MAKLPKEFKDISDKLNSESADLNYGQTMLKIDEARDRCIRHANNLTFIEKVTAILLSSFALLISGTKEYENENKFYATDTGKEYKQTELMLNSFNNLHKNAYSWNNALATYNKNLKEAGLEKNLESFSEPLITAEKSNKELLELIQEKKTEEEQKQAKLEQTSEFKEYNSEKTRNSDIQISAILFCTLAFAYAGISNSIMKKRAHTATYELSELADKKYNPANKSALRFLT